MDKKQYLLGCFLFAFFFQPYFCYSKITTGKASLIGASSGASFVGTGAALAAMIFINNTQKDRLSSVTPKRKKYRNHNQQIKLPTTVRQASLRSSKSQQDRTLNKPIKRWCDILKEWRRGEVSPALLDGLRNRNCYFETTPLTREGDTHFRYKIIDAKLTSKPNASPFGDQVEGPQGGIVAFENLGRDGWLVSPTDNGEHFANIHEFAKNASDEQIAKLFVTLAETAIDGADQYGKIWVSTHGGGVSWLHGRIDSEPRYYHTQAFKKL